MNTKKKPIGFVAICQCGEMVGAMDYQRTDRKEAGKLLGSWLAEGCVVQPRFPGWGSERITPCRCKKESVETPELLEKGGEPK